MPLDHAGPHRARNDPAQYDDLTGAWWDRRGPLAMLHWIAVARAALVPPATRPGAVLLDVGCGGGLMAPHVPPGYRHLGVDVTRSALDIARERGVTVLQARAGALPLRTGSVDVVVAGEILEHVPQLEPAVREVCRVLAPGGTLVIDTITTSWLSRLIVVELAERLPGGPPRGLHDPALFVDPAELGRQCARLGVPLRIRGVRPSFPEYVAWLAHRRQDVTIIPSRLPAILFQAIGVKDGGELAGPGKRGQNGAA